MKYQAFGRKSGLRVSELALGTGMFGQGWGYGADKNDSKKMFDAYAEAGGNFIDTADVYQMGQSEIILSDLISQDRSHFVLATKYTMGVGSEKRTISHKGNSRKNMFHSVEQSLKRLKTEYIDILWVHAPDGITPLEEILRGMEDLERSGKIHYGGLSNFPAWQVARASTMAELKSFAPLIGIQIEYNLVERTAERDLLPMAEALGLGVAFWSPLAGGMLTGKYRKGEQGRKEKMGGALFREESTTDDKQVLDAVLAVAVEANWSATEISIAWLLHRSKISATSMIPILGPRTFEQLKGNLSATEIQLSDAQYQRINEASRISFGVLHDQIQKSAEALAGAGNVLESAKVPIS